MYVDLFEFNYCIYVKYSIFYYYFYRIRMYFVKMESINIDGDVVIVDQKSTMA